MKIGDYVIVRSDRAGCFAGTLSAKDCDQITLANARRLWKWVGAASLSELAMKGVSKPDECLFPPEVDEIVVFGTIELLATTEEAKRSIADVPIWTAH